MSNHEHEAMKRVLEHFWPFGTRALVIYSMQAGPSWMQIQLR